MLRNRSGRWLGLAVLLTLSVSACSPGRRPIAAAPAPHVAEPEEIGDAPELVVGEVRDVARELLGDVAYDLPVEANSWVAGELEWLVRERRAVIARWLERGDPYEEEIKEILRGHGLPTDLYHLAMIESGFVPTARSRAGAVGIWQFMPATARDVGLRVDSLVDERMDPIRSTHAAARHLRSLIAQHRGDWALAAASYNAGSGRIGRSMQRHGVSNFWDLAVHGDLADETKHYVPRLYAMTIIARDRERFGFAPRPTLARRPFTVDSVFTDFATPFAELARIGDVPADAFERLNPHLVRRTTPQGRYKLWVPAGTGPMLQQAYLDSDFRRQRGYGVYVVRRGDSLGRITQSSGVRSRELRELNPSVDFDALKVGARLKMPYLAAQRIEAEPARESAPAVAARTEKPRTETPRAEKPRAETPRPAAAVQQHEVGAGETLWGVAQRYGVTVAQIEAANSLKGSTIRAGQRLSIPSAAGAAPARAVAARAAKPSAAEHVVRNGETLWAIAREYGSTVDSIQTANRISDGRIVPGQKLIIPLASR